MNIIVADDHTIVLEGLELLLSTFDFVDKVKTSTNSTELFELLKEEPVEIILLDINLGREDGREVCKNIKKEYPDIKIIALTSYSDRSTFKSAMLAGFDAYLLKSEDRNTVMQALQNVSKGEQFFSPQLKDLLFEQNLRSGKKVELSAREIEVLQLIVDEKTTKEIANELFISEKTVEGHRSNLMLKLDVKNMAGLVKKAITLGYVE